MKEIKVGEYVRTRSGKIDIFKEKDENYLFARCEKNTYWIPDIAKHSKNIIDLIEIGDYVNGEQIDFITNKGDLLIRDNVNFFDKYKGIKTILTKEQFEQNLYKI